VFDEYVIDEKKGLNIARSEALNSCPVNIHNEWDPLEEIIVGVIDDIRVPEWHCTLDAVIPNKAKDFFKNNQRGRFPPEILKKADEELNSLVHILTGEGITVKRPRAKMHHKPFSTPDWTVGGSFHSAMPRDSIFVIGDTIIETPMAWRNRYFETHPFREILIDYFRKGANWISAPKPILSDESYNLDYDPNFPHFNSVITEFEPLFDAADFIKLGYDIIGQQSHVTNQLGIDWLQRQLSKDYTIHIYEFDDKHPMHIDTTILPLAPGKVMVNNAWVSTIPSIFKNWDVLIPPPSVLSDEHPLFMTSKWISLNILMLDEKRVIVEKDEHELINFFKKAGFEPILCPFKNFQSLGGSFHCATLDVRRKGAIQRYL
jgi:glycine amidinotransferase